MCPIGVTGKCNFSTSISSINNDGVMSNSSSACSVISTHLHIALQLKEKVREREKCCI